MSTPRLTRTERLLLVAFAYSVALLFIDNMVTSRSERQIHERAVSLASNAGPSLLELSGTQRALADVMAALEAMRSAPPGRADGQPLTRAMEALSAHAGGYERLNRYPGEDRPRSAFIADVQKLTAAVDAEAASLQGGARPAGHDPRLLSAVQTLRGDIGTLIELNASQTQALSQKMEALHRRSRGEAWAADSLSALLAIVVGLLMVRTVRSSRRELEAKTAQVEQRAGELEQFSSRMAHDVLSPLGAQDLAWQMVERHYGGDPRLMTLAKRGRGSLRQTRQLVDGLLGFALAGAKPQSGAQCAVSEVLSDVVEGLRAEAQEAGVELSLAPTPDVLVACNPGILTSLVANLVRNALKYIGKGPVRRVVVRAVAADGEVRVEVSDTGPGIPPELQSRVFEPYVRATNTSAPGIGLGLATVRRLTEAHGGRVGLSSELGQGSIFWFELPTVPGDELTTISDPEPQAHAP